MGNKYPFAQRPAKSRKAYEVTIKRSSGRYLISTKYFNDDNHCANWSSWYEAQGYGKVIGWQLA